MCMCIPQAALLNEFYARKYKGKLILRFDDTNPSKEKAEFENAIIADLATLGIKPDQASGVADNFIPAHTKRTRRGRDYDRAFTSFVSQSSCMNAGNVYVRLFPPHRRLCAQAHQARRRLHGRHPTAADAGGTLELHQFRSS